jgi:hypothetical protein
MKWFIAIVIFPLSGCLHQAVMPHEDMVLTKEIKVPGMTRDQMFDRSETWIYRHLYSDEGNILHTDRGAGVIVVRSTVEYPTAGRLDAIAKIQYTISFTMRVEVMEHELWVTFEDLMVNVPKNYPVTRRWNFYEYTGGYSVPVTKRSDFEAAKKGLLDLADRLGSHLRANLP